MKPATEARPGELEVGVAPLGSLANGHSHLSFYAFDQESDERDLEHVRKRGRLLRQRQEVTAGLELALQIGGVDSMQRPCEAALATKHGGGVIAVFRAERAQPRDQVWVGRHDDIVFLARVEKAPYAERIKPALVNGLPYPVPSSPAVTARMRRNRRQGTRPEARLRSELHRLGLRYRKDDPIRASNRTVRPDVVFTRARVAVFVDGCFWHSCPLHGSTPRTNDSYWRAKLEMNVARDRAVDEALREEGWVVLRYWEHEDPYESAMDVVRTLSMSETPKGQAARGSASTADRRASS